jgi:hypothetical protein
MNYINTLDSKHKGMLSPGWDWSMCIGAGVCFGILPTWGELTRRILSRIKGKNIDSKEFYEISGRIGWSLDSILQYCSNEYIEKGNSIADFYEILQEELYSDLLKEAENQNLKEKLTEFISDPFKRKDGHILELSSFFRNTYGHTSLIKVCDFLIKSKEQNKNPIAVLNFNADVLLHSVLTLFQLEDEYKKTGKLNVTDFYYKSIHKTGDNNGGRIPIYHLHGSIVPFENRKEARHNLVFLESSYSDVAGSFSSWQHSIFQYYTQRTKQVFIGLSMSDLNIRRWLSWVSKIISQEIKFIADQDAIPQKHLWITTQPKNDLEFEIKANGLSHLAIKTGYIPDWSDLDQALNNLFYLK